MTADSHEGTERAITELGIRRLAARYCVSVDDGQFGEFERLWSDDARMHVMGATYVGAGAIRGFLEPAQPPELRGKHFTSSHLIEWGDSDAPSGSVEMQRAVGWVDFVFFDRSGKCLQVGRYHDEYVHLAGDSDLWQFSVREIVFIGESPQITDPPRIFG